MLSHQGKKEFSSPVEPMTPEALALHFIDDLDSKINQLRNLREASTGMQYHRGLGRYVYLPPPTAEDLLAAEEAAEIAAISAEPHELEAREMELPPEPEAADASPPVLTEENEEEQAPLFRGE